MIAKKKAKQLKTTIFWAKNVRPETLATHDAMADAAVTAAQAYPISWLADEICTKAIKVKTPVTIKLSLVICNFLLAFCSRASVFAQNFFRVSITQVAFVGRLPCAARIHVTQLCVATYQKN